MSTTRTALHRSHSEVSNANSWADSTHHIQDETIRSDKVPFVHGAEAV
jgi:hypothetical protein